MCNTINCTLINAIYFIMLYTTPVWIHGFQAERILCNLWYWKCHNVYCSCIFEILTLSSRRVFKKMLRFSDYTAASSKSHFDKPIWLNLYAVFVLYDVTNISSIIIFNYSFNGTTYIKIHQELLMLEANICHHGRELRNKLR